MSVVRGSVTPRLWTPPLRELTRDTTYGYELIDFADEVGAPLDPWQEWLAVHSGELLPDGRPRFRIVLVLVSRQNGKTHYGKVISAWWLHVDLPGTVEFRRPTVLGISSKVDYAKEPWQATVDLCKGSPLLAAELPPKPTRESNGETTLFTTHGTRYKIAAANDDAGRSLTVDRLLVDELRRQQSWTAWSAAEPTTSSVAGAQIVCLSNQGDERSVVLNSLRESALQFIETGEGDPRLGIFEWSAPDDSDPTDVHALAAANPNLNHPDGRNPLDALMGAAIRAKARGGEELAKFRIESMCMKVRQLDPAVDGAKWEACAVEDVSLEDAAGRVAAVLDVSPDGEHATLVAGALLDNGKVRLGVIEAWDGPDALADCASEFPGLVAELKPRRLGWFPSGPAAALAADLADRDEDDPRGAWPPKGVEVEELRFPASVCMGLAAQVRALKVEHNGDELLEKHVTGAEKLYSGDGWRFTRRSAGHCDAAYAVAGVVRLALTLPPPPKPVGKPRLILPSGKSSGRPPA